MNMKIFAQYCLNDCKFRVAGEKNHWFTKKRVSALTPLCVFTCVPYFYLYLKKKGARMEPQWPRERDDNSTVLARCVTSPGGATPAALCFRINRLNKRKRN